MIVEYYYYPCSSYFYFLFNRKIIPHIITIICFSILTLLYITFCISMIQVKFIQKKQFKSCNVRTILNWLHSQKIWSLHGSKNTIAFKQANSVSSTCASRSVVDNSSMIRQPMRLISISWDCLGITKSFPSNSVSFKCIDRRARPSSRCSPAWARRSATWKVEQKSYLFCSHRVAT